MNPSVNDPTVVELQADLDQNDEPEVIELQR